MYIYIVFYIYNIYIWYIHIVKIKKSEHQNSSPLQRDLDKEHLCTNTHVYKFPTKSVKLYCGIADE